MTVKHAFLAGLVAVGLSMGGMPVALAQEAGMIDEVVEFEGRPPEDNWFKVCSDLEDGRKACIMRQVVTNSGVFVGSFLLRDDPSQESRLVAVAAVPLGVMLPFGLSWQIDSGRPVRVPYMTCDPQTCQAHTAINQSILESLKRGAKLKLIYTNRLFQEVTTEIDLAGFTAVYDNPDALDIDQLNEASSTENALEQILQDRAEQLRQQLQQSASGGGSAEETPPAEEEAPAE